MAAARRCDYCDQPYIAKTGRSRFCSDLCRANNGGKPKLEPALVAAGDTFEATWARFEAAQILDDPSARAALVLARRVDANTDNGSAMAALVREFRVTFDAVMASTRKTVDPVDELKAKRDGIRDAAAG